MLKRYFENAAVLSLLSSMLFATQFPLIKLGLGHIPAPVAAVPHAPPDITARSNRPRAKII